MYNTPITQQLWALVIGNNPSYFKNHLCPVEMVTWIDACVFCNKLSLLHGLQPCYYRDSSFEEVIDYGSIIQNCDIFWHYSANGYRLPTETEWQYACLAGEEDRVDMKGIITKDQLNCESNATRIVKSYFPNSWLLYDMLGNTWEWCWDWFENYHFEPQEKQKGSNAAYCRVIRGGSFNSRSQACYHAQRNGYPPNECRYDIGFRIVTGSSESLNDQHI